MAVHHTDMNQLPNDNGEIPQVDLKQIRGVVKTITTIPTYIPNTLEQQIKILRAPATSTGGRAGVVLDQAIINNDATFIYNTTGQAITSTSTGAMPAPLVSGTTYYIIRVSDGYCKFATSYANALAGTAIHITSGESGVWTITATGAPNDSIAIYDTISNAWRYAPIT